MNWDEAINRISLCREYEENLDFKLAVDYIKRTHEWDVQECIEVHKTNFELAEALEFFFDYFKENPVCELCAKFDPGSGNYGYTKECENCGWYPWADENKIPFRWVWRGKKK